MINSLTKKFSFLKQKYKEILKEGFHSPNKPFIFEQLTKPKDLKIVFIGLEPYPVDPQRIPFELKKLKKNSSLKNLLYWLKVKPSSYKGSLLPWIKQGVFIYNLYPTYDYYRKKNKKWLEFSKLLLEYLQELNKKLIFITFGETVKKATKKFLILKYAVPHPSPNNTTKKLKFFLKDRLKFLLKEQLIWNFD